ncbi:MAG: FIST N-terminal domain-containing protein [Verrucomicrobiales bacterium]|nr:FIST N-terminal domain-containing protein [Verrucomicrobiales bacterium]
MTESPPSAVSCLLPGPLDSGLMKEALEDAREKLAAPPDLAICFVSSDFRKSLPDLIEHFQIDGHATTLVGASASGLLGVGQESENQTGISFLLLRLPGVEITRESDFSSRPRRSTPPPAGAIVLAHPFRSSAGEMTTSLQERFPRTPVLGGQISGGPELDDLFLFTEEGISREPMLTITFSGAIRMEPLVAQACRPIGEPLIVTGAQGTSLTSIASRKPLQVLEDAFTELTLRDQETAQGNIFAGVAIEEEREEFTSGDFLIRPILSADLDRGELELSSPTRVGQTLQFQLRSPAVATETLKAECDHLFEAHGKPFASLLFAGRERGVELFGEDNHDINIFENNFGSLPVAGIFGSGEIGPAGNRLFHHDHSFCGALFYPQENAD